MRQEGPRWVDVVSIGPARGVAIGGTEQQADLVALA
jgi:hypothetical protein